jgi:type IV secretory pathway VirB10-like protein
MDWIFDNFQILAIVGLALASWLKSRADAKAAEREEQEARRELEEPNEVFGPDEAWGAPYQEPAPPAPPPLVRVAPPPVPVVETQGELKRQLEMQERLRQLRETKAVTSGGAAVTRARSKDAKPAKTAAAVPVGLRGALRNHGQVRRAIVMREILGPPLGLR